MRIVFMGTPIFAKNILQGLVESGKYDVVAVYTNEDAIRGRGNKLVSSPVKQYAVDAKIPVETPKNFKCAEVVQKLKNYNPDFICVAAYGKILPKDVLDIPRACLNVHGSLLPKWRGAAPVQRAILSGDDKTGTSIMKMDEGLDTGDYSLQSKFEIGNKNLEQIFTELSNCGLADLMQVLDNYDNITWKKQDESIATLAEKLDKRELWLKSDDSLQTALRKIKASSSQCPAKCAIAGRCVTIIDAEIRDNNLHIKNLKPDGKSEMTWEAFIAGVQDKSSENLLWREIE